MNISYDYYKVFYYVAKYRSFTQAASALYSNQPNITRVIKNLEKELGCTLFVRSNRSVMLTPEGEKLYQHIRISVEHIVKGEEELSLDRSMESGTVSLCASETALHCLLFPVLNKYHTLYPGIHIKIFNYSSQQAIAALKNGLVDIAVVTTPAQVPKPLAETKIKSFREIPVCGKSFAFLTGKKITLQELLQHPFICLGTQTMTYEFYSQFFLAHGFHLTPDIEVATADQILLMVKNNLGIGFIPEPILEQFPTPNDIFPLDLQESVPERSICLIRRRDQILSIAAHELEKMILPAAR